MISHNFQAMRFVSLSLALFVSYYRAAADDDQYSPDKVLSFLLLGDWGKGGTSGTYGQRRALDDALNATELKHMELNSMELQKDQQKKVFRQMQVATAMGQYGAQASPKPSFIITLGDNFYGDGVYSTSDPLWKYLWKDVYLGFEELKIPWFPVFGNHDYGYGATGLRAQITRTYEHTDDDIWTFPSTNYTQRFAIPGEEGGSVAVVFIDTTTLAPTVNKCCNSNGGVSTTEQQERIANQLAHIERMLNDTLADPPTWLLVAGHYPMYSASSNGDTAELQTYLQPLLEKYKVHAYFCGHDHIGEHLRKAGQHTEYFVVGAGTMVDTISKTSNAELIWAGPNYASFAAVNATISNLTIAYRDSNGTLRYNYTLTNPNPLFVPIISDTEKEGGDGDSGGSVSAGGNSGAAGDIDDEGGGDGEGDEGEGEVSHSSTPHSSQSFFSWSFWTDAAHQASNADIAMASGGVAAIGLLCFLCFAIYKRRNEEKKDQAHRELLLKAYNLKLLHSPSHKTPPTIRSFHGHKKYSQLKEVGDIEQGEVARDFSEEEEEYNSDIDSVAGTVGTVIKDDQEASLTGGGIAIKPAKTSRHRINERVHHRFRSSNFSSVMNTSNRHGRHSHMLTPEQSAAAAAWLESHPASTALTDVSPPLALPGESDVLLPERSHSLYVAKQVPESLPKNPSEGGFLAPDAPHSPSSLEGPYQQPHSSPVVRPPTRSSSSSTSLGRHMSVNQRISSMDAVSAADGSLVSVAGTAATALNRVQRSSQSHQSASRHHPQRSNTPQN